MRFFASQHLRKAAEFRRLRERGVCVDCGPFVAYYLVEGSEEGASGRLPRLGVIASRRVGPAVVRNRVKRRFRELFRRCQEKLPRDCSLILIARRSCADREFGDLERRFVKLCGKVSAADHETAD